MENAITLPLEYKAKRERNVLISVLILGIVSAIAGWLAVVSEPLYNAVTLS